MANVVCVGPQSWTIETYDRLPAGYVLIRECSNYALRRFLETLRPDFAFFLNWSDIVRPDIVRDFECVNFHCTPLPYGRGGHPIENMIISGHVTTRICAHRMTEEVDAGPCYTSSEAISLRGTKEQILARFVGPCALMIHWISGAFPTPQPQLGNVVKFKRLSRQDYVQFWEDRA